MGVGGSMAGELIIQYLPPHLITLVRELKSTDSETDRILLVHVSFNNICCGFNSKTCTGGGS